MRGGGCVRGGIFLGGMWGFEGVGGGREWKGSGDCISGELVGVVWGVVVEGVGEVGEKNGKIIGCGLGRILEGGGRWRRGEGEKIGRVGGKKNGKKK